MRGRTSMLALVGMLTAACASTIYDKAAQTWDTWLGASKDERVRDLGIPTRCHTFRGGGEACEWPIRWNSEATGTMTVHFDPRGQACQWTYRDTYEDRRSRNTCP
jgi:hypothetical protein